MLVDPDYPVKVEGDASDQQEQASGAGEPLTLQSLSQLLDQRISSLASDVREAVAEREERVMQELLPRVKALAAIAKYGIEKDVGYISTGGGAFLEVLEGKTLPAFEILGRRAAG